MGWLRDLTVAEPTAEELESLIKESGLTLGSIAHDGAAQDTLMTSPTAGQRQYRPFVSTPDLRR